MALKNEPPISFLQRGSPTSTECDFHCCALHNPPAASASTSHKSSTATAGAASGGPATSPLQPSTEATAASTSQQQQEAGKRSLPKGAHVRFSHVEVDRAAQDNGKTYSNDFKHFFEKCR